MRQLVSATTVCRRPANQRSAFLTATISLRASKKQPSSAATSTSSTIFGSHHDPWPASATAAAVQQVTITPARR